MDITPPQPSQSTPNPSQDPLDAAKASELDVDATAAAQTTPIFTATVADMNIAQSHIKSGKSFKLPVTIVVVVLLLVLAGGFGGAYYYFFARLQNSDYDTAAGQADVLVSDVKATSNITDTLRNQQPTLDTSKPPVSVADMLQKMETKVSAGDIKHVADVSLQVQDYIANLAKLKSSDAVIRDGAIGAEYANDAAKIEAYGSNMADISKSIGTYLTVESKWNTFATSITTIKSMGDYDTLTKDLTEYLQQQATVPVKDFSDTVYKSLRDYMQGAMADTRTALIAYLENNSKQYSLGIQKLETDKSNAAVVAKQAQAYTFKMPDDPTSSLQNLQSAINDRKNVFWR
ncbi:MAG: hypothetical protein JWO07_501 [Candidatus Saccharibacteria bacterium]|nr:hypothetical protein [Candidatus Saccharibacteria bacterium]